MRVPVGIVLAHPDERDLRLHCGEEARQARSRTVMGDLQDVGSQPRRITQQQALRLRLDVTGQEHGALLDVDAQDQ
jgi:hypothetical protein